MSAKNNNSHANNSKQRTGLIGAGVAYLIIAGLIIFFFTLSQRSPVQTEPYDEKFDADGSWKVGEGVNAQGFVVDGAYEMSIDPDLGGDVFWATAGENFADGSYEVEATPLEGAIDNGYGMLFRVDEGRDSFYVFKVSSDGYVFLGRCADGCLEEEALVNQDWFDSPSVQVGLGVTNHLKVDVSGADMVFFVNGDEVGRASDNTLEKGDIGLLAETFTPGGLLVAFDNFRVTPVESVED
jgi:hypothetical protein